MKKCKLLWAEDVGFRINLRFRVRISTLNFLVKYKVERHGSAEVYIYIN